MLVYCQALSKGIYYVSHMYLAPEVQDNEMVIAISSQNGSADNGKK